MTIITATIIGFSVLVGFAIVYMICNATEKKLELIYPQWVYDWGTDTGIVFQLTVLALFLGLGILGIVGA